MTAPAAARHPASMRPAVTGNDGRRSGRRGPNMIMPLALARFASYPATNMNLAISAIARDLRTTVAGVQTAITLFTLTMAALGSQDGGSSLGSAPAGSVLVAVKPSAGKPFAAGLATMMVITLAGLVLAVLIPRQHVQAIEPASSVTAAPA
jgi:hypothetical protein